MTRNAEALKATRRQFWRAGDHLVDLLNKRDRLRADLARPRPRWCEPAEWAARCQWWHERLDVILRLVQDTEATMTRLDGQLAALLQTEAEEDAREAQREASERRGYKGAYPRRLRPNLKPLPLTALQMAQTWRERAT
jgi:hypothetical protein